MNTTDNQPTTGAPNLSRAARQPAAGAHFMHPHRGEIQNSKPRTECAGRGVASSQSHRYLAVIQWLAVRLAHGNSSTGYGEFEELVQEV